MAGDRAGIHEEKDKGQNEAAKLNRDGVQAFGRGDFPQDRDVLALHRRLALDALHGRQPVLGAEELREVLRYSSGYGVGSFPARIRPERVEDAQRALKTTSAQATFGRLKRLGHSARSFLQKQFGLGSASGGLLPLALLVQGTVADEQRLPQQLTFARLRNFRRHPAMTELFDPNGRFIIGLEKDLAEEAPELKPRALDDGKVIITMNWFIYLPEKFTFFSRPGVAAWPLHWFFRSYRQKSLPQALPAPAAAHKSGGYWLRSGAEATLRGRHSAPVLSGRWFDPKLAPFASAQPSWCSAGLSFVGAAAWVPKRSGNSTSWASDSADIIGDQKEMENLGRDIATRQAVATKLITSAAISETGRLSSFLCLLLSSLAQAEGGPDPRSMSLERCYEVLKLSRDDVRAAQSTSKEEAKSRLARAFRLRVMEDLDAEKRQVEEVGLALDVLMRNCRTAKVRMSAVQKASSSMDCPTVPSAAEPLNYHAAARQGRQAEYGERWGEGAARYFSIEADFLDEDQSIRLMPVPESFFCPISATIMPAAKNF
eukprot:g3090.t2